MNITRDLVANVVASVSSNTVPGEFSMHELIGPSDAAWYKAGTTLGPVTSLADWSPNGNDATTADGPAVVTRHGASYLQYTYPEDTVQLDWPMAGKTGVFGFASIHGAQVFNLRPDAQMPRIQFIEAVFVERNLTTQERADLLTYLESKCPATLWNAELLGTEYNHNYLAYENPADSFVLTFSDAQQIQAPPWDAPDFYTKLVTLGAARGALRFVSDDRASVLEYEVDGETFEQTVNIVPKNISEYVGCQWMELLGFVQGSLPPWSTYPQLGTLEYLSVGDYKEITGGGGALCGDFPALVGLPPGLTTLLVIAPGVKWDTVDISTLPASITTFGFHEFTTTGPMPALNTLPNVLQLDFRNVGFTSGSIPATLTTLTRLDLHQCNRTGLAPNPGRYPNMYRYHLRGNLLTGFDAAVTINNNCDYVNLQDNALTEAAVDELLAAHVLADPTIVGKTYKRISLNNGTNAAPSVAGLANVAIMQGRGWTVEHN